MIWAFIGSIGIVIAIGLAAFMIGYQVGLDEGRETKPKQRRRD